MLRCPLKAPWFRWCSIVAVLSPEACVRERGRIASVQLSFPLVSAFLALPLEGEAKQQFGKCQGRLGNFGDLFRLQLADRPHLTLQFWRSLMEIEYQQVRRQAGNIAQRVTPFTIQVGEGETFAGPRGEERVLFLGVAYSDELARIRKLCPWPAGKPFHPHITLARMANPQAFRVHRKKVLRLLEDVRFSFRVDRLRLYAQVEGKRQTPLEEFVFATERTASAVQE